MACLRLLSVSLVNHALVQCTLITSVYADVLLHAQAAATALPSLSLRPARLNVDQVGNACVSSLALSILYSTLIPFSLLNNVQGLLEARRYGVVR
jgi:hypothetical protein